MATEQVKIGDDLQAIVEIDSELESRLSEHKIHYFRQIALWGKSQRRIFGARIGVSIDEAWSVQARALLEAKTGEVIEEPDEEIEPDDLTQINGISADIVGKLKKAEIEHFRQIALWGKSQRRIIGNRIGMTIDEAWSVQAREIVQLKTGEVIEEPDDEALQMDNISYELAEQEEGPAEYEMLKGRKQVRYFLIHSMPRAASTSFRMWMNSTVGCVCHGEILGAEDVRGTSHKQEKHWTLAERKENPKEFFFRYFFDHKGHATGFKALSSHLVDKNNLKFLKAFFLRKPFVINLYRRNLIDRFSSTKFHRMQIGFVKPEDILALTPIDILLDCSETVEDWNSAIMSWTKKLDFINLDIQNITEEQRHVIERKLRIWLDEPLGKANTKSGKSGREIFSDAAAHLEAICADPILDPFRNIDLGSGNMIYAMQDIELPSDFVSPYAKNKSDDLTKIDGINKFLELKLNQNKTYFFGQMAGWNEKRIHVMSRRIGHPVNPAWIEAAKNLNIKKS